jgi:hypothetical protein
MISNQKGKGPMHYPCCRCNDLSAPRSRWIFFPFGFISLFALVVCDR